MKILRGSWLTSGCALFMTACSAGSGPDIEVTSGSPVETREEAVLGNALSSAQAHTALKLIDDICADTWCSGDYDFGFRPPELQSRCQDLHPDPAGISARGRA